MKASRRNALPARSFGLPGSRKLPMDTVGRAKAAKGRATQMAKKGTIAPSTRDKVHAKANRVIKRGKGIK